MWRVDRAFAGPVHRRDKSISQKEFVGIHGGTQVGHRAGPTGSAGHIRSVSRI